jgi:molybdopterin-guanine dinucleotide biosynthesis protein
MRPFIIGIGGAHSKVGKTTIACRILKRLNGWGAIKYTKTSFSTSIIDSPEILKQENKDTSRLINAGAQDVLWVQSPPEDLKEVLQIAIDRLSHLKGIILEGNSAVEALKPDIVVFVSGNEGLKRGAEKILCIADVVIFGKNPPKETPETVKRIRLNNEEEYVNFIVGLVSEDENRKIFEGYT